MHSNAKRALRLLTIAVGTYCAAASVAGIFLAEFTLHPPRLQPSRWFVQNAAAHYGTVVRDIGLQAADGAILRGWYAVPPRDNGNAVVLLHGVGDTREGVAGYATIFLAQGYRVLLADSRAHGESGGRYATYGVLERHDTARWVEWLYAAQHSNCVYGFGESMGAAIVLQSLAVEPNWCAVVAESPFANFRDVGYDREGLYLRLGPWFGQTFGRLPIEVGLLYARLRYGLALMRARPIDAVRTSSVPVLFIHGLNDTNILPRHSALLHASDPAHSELWLVPRAEHTGAWATDPQQFERRVLGWFAQHPRARLQSVTRTH